MSFNSFYSSWKNRLITVVLIVGFNMIAEAGLYDSNKITWKEEVLLHDGSTIIVERSQVYGGRHEIGQTPPIKEQEITFSLPGTRKSVTWKNEYGEDLGRANFILLALHILDRSPYIVASPNLCLSYNKWGRPNPPYVVFKYNGKDWERIALSDLPVELTEINMVVSTKAEEDVIKTHPLVSVDLVKEINSRLERPEYKTLLREEIKPGSIGSSVNCEELVYYKGVWVSPGDSIGKRMMDKKPH